MRGPRLPTDRSRRDDIEAAVAAYDQANKLAPLPRNAVRLLAAMFIAGDVYQGSLEGFCQILRPTSSVTSGLSSPDSSGRQ